MDMAGVQSECNFRQESEAKLQKIEHEGKGRRVGQRSKGVRQ